jgi:tetratricopeptide (TPR) repeat protein
MHKKVTVLMNIRKYDEALIMYDHVISVGRDKLGDDHHDTLATMYNKALVLDNMGKYNEALIMYDHVLSVERD